MVEDVLVLTLEKSGEADIYVLILVVVEDVLVQRKLVWFRSPLGSLNPCCGGRCSSTTVGDMFLSMALKSLNPCCGGRCSSTSYLYFS